MHMDSIYRVEQHNGWRGGGGKGVGQGWQGVGTAAQGS